MAHSDAVADAVEASSNRGRLPVQLMGSGEGMPVGLHYRKGWALLGYLALERNRTHARTAIAALLWPELDERAALTNLRQVLVDLNRFCERNLGPGVLNIQRTSVALLAAEQHLFDTDLIQHAPAQGLDILLQGRSFLHGMEDIAGADFQCWLESVRQMLDAQLLGSAEAHCDALIVQRQWRKALPLAKALSQRDPWDEANARRMMRVHAGTGMRAAAVRVYQHLESCLWRELGVKTTAATRELLADICGERKWVVARQVPFTISSGRRELSIA